MLHVKTAAGRRHGRPRVHDDAAVRPRGGQRRSTGMAGSPTRRFRRLIRTYRRALPTSSYDPHLGPSATAEALVKRSSLSQIHPCPHPLRSPTTLPSPPQTKTHAPAKNGMKNRMMPGNGVPKRSLKTSYLRSRGPRHARGKRTGAWVDRRPCRRRALAGTRIPRGPPAPRPLHRPRT